MNSFEFRVSTGLIKVPVNTEQPTTNFESEISITARALLRQMGTLKEASLLTSIQITRVFRLVSEKAEFRLSEIEKVFSATGRALKIEPCLKEEESS